MTGNTSRWRICIVVALVATMHGCSAHRPILPHVETPAVSGGLDAFLRRHPLAADQNIRVELLERTEQASWHLVQVRHAESPHEHPDHDLQVVVLRGTGVLHLAGRPVPLRRGDVALIPRGVAHWFANDGEAPAVALVTYVPPAPLSR